MEYAGAKDREERLASGYAGRLFLAVSIGWVGIQVGRQLLPPLLPAIMDDLGIAPFQAGIALTALWATYALTHYPGGRLADELTRKTVLVGGLVILAAGFFLLGFADFFSIFFVAVMIVGVGAALFFISMRATAADLYVTKRSLAFGIQNSFGNVGGAAAAGVSVLVLAVATWRSAFLPIAIFFVIVAAVLHRWSREPYVVERVDVGLFETGRRVFGNVAIRRVLATYVLLVFTWQGVIGFLPTFLQVDKGLSPTLASAGFAIVYLIGIGVGPLAGNVGDRYAKLPVAAGALLFAAVGLSALLSFDSLPALGGAIVVFAIGFWSYPPVVQAYLMDLFDDDSMAGDLGAVKAVYSGAGSLGPTYVGLIAGWWSYTAAYFGLIGCLLLSLSLLALIWWTGT